MEVAVIKKNKMEVKIEKMKMEADETKHMRRWMTVLRRRMTLILMF